MQGWEGYYSVSSAGEVYSHVRRIIKTVSANKYGYHRTSLYAPGVRPKCVSVHRIVCEAFHGPPPEDKPLVLHRDGNKSNNEASNLRWGSQSENIQDSLRHGTHREARKTHCIRGHPFDKENTYVTPKGHRRCVKCRAIHYQQLKDRGWTRAKRMPTLKHYFGGNE